MSKGFLTHFIIILVLHLALLFGGYEILDSDFAQSVRKLGSNAITMTVSREQRSVTPRVQTPQKPQEKEIVPKEEVSQTQGTSQGHEVGDSQTGPSSNDIATLYKAELRARIDKNKYYPPMSKRLGQTGVVVVAFTLLEDGNIIDIRIEKPSRYERLNASALDAVKKVQRFKPIPKEIGESRMDIKVPLKFVTI